MPESPLGLVYAGRAFAASVAAKTRTISWVFLQIQCSGVGRGNRPRVVSETETDSRCKFFGARRQNVACSANVDSAARHTKAFFTIFVPGMERHHRRGR